MPVARRGGCATAESEEIFLNASKCFSANHRANNLGAPREHVCFLVAADANFTHQFARFLQRQGLNCHRVSAIFDAMDIRHVSEGQRLTSHHRRKIRNLRPRRCVNTVRQATTLQRRPSKSPVAGKTEADFERF
jgi:hypothetical protein